MHASPLLLTALAGLTTVYAGYVFSKPPTPGEQVTYLKNTCCRVHGPEKQIATCNKRYCDINMDRVTWPEMHAEILKPDNKIVELRYEDGSRVGVLARKIWT